MTTWDEIRARIEQSEMTQKEIGRRVGAHPTTVSRWMGSVKGPKKSMQKRILEILKKEKCE